MTTIKTAAIIGSFKQYYSEVLEVWKLFSNIGLEITSPKGAPIIEEGIPFVRFITDPDYWDDAMVQTVTLHRILRADFVYVVAPKGYVGRTTCYEVGRIIQAQQPVYFSEHPKDLPVRVSGNHIISPKSISQMIKAKKLRPEPLYISSTCQQSVFEKDVLLGCYRGDDEFDNEE